MKAWLFIPIFLIATFSLPTRGDYPYFFFKNSQIQISKNQYRRYVRPQLVAIVNEYYSLLKRLDPKSSDPIDLKEKVLELSKHWNTYLRSRCPGDASCENKGSEIYQFARRVDTMILKMQAKPLDLIIPDDEESKDSEVGLTRQTDNLSLLSYQLIHFLEEHHLFQKTPFAHFSRSQKEITDTITQLKIATELLITQKLDPAFKKDFDRLWIGFIVTLEQDILDQEGPEKLIHNMGALNLAWNTFQMKMTKGNDHFPKALVPLVLTMHNRWNSFLKTALRD